MNEISVAKIYNDDIEEWTNILGPLRNIRPFSNNSSLFDLDEHQITLLLSMQTSTNGVILPKSAHGILRKIRGMLIQVEIQYE